MSQRTCSIESCGRPHKARGWCGTHYLRWRVNGDVAVNTPVAKMHRSPDEAFAANTEPHENGCLIWTGGITQRGYGAITVKGKTVLVHRFAWERVYGAIPEGMVIDHICWVPECVNIHHLRLATPSQNSRSRQGHDAKSSTKIRNVYKRGDRWRVILVKHGQRYYFGTFGDKEEAAAVAERARLELYGAWAGKG